MSKTVNGPARLGGRGKLSLGVVGQGHGSAKGRGGAVAQEPRRDAKSFPPWRYAGGLAASVAILYFTAFMTGTSLQAQPALTVVLFVALAELAWSSRYGWVAGLLLSAVYFQLEHAAVWIATPLHRETAWLAPPLLLVFLALAIAQANQHTWSQTEFARGLYVHARNGFYLNTLANRFTMAIRLENRPGKADRIPSLTAPSSASPTGSLRILAISAISRDMA